MRKLAVLTLMAFVVVVITLPSNAATSPGQRIANLKRQVAALKTNNRILRGQ